MHGLFGAVSRRQAYNTVTIALYLTTGINCDDGYDIWLAYLFEVS